MHRPEINLFQHPTTTVYIDDSTAFLYSITLAVDQQPFRSFSDPLAGLNYLEQYAYQYDQDPEEQPADTRNAGKLGHALSRLAEQKLQNHARFAEPSVVVVDYSMPEINGLDLCSRITNPYIKKVLLTGVADEKIAVKALNTELIDFYISKGESSLSQELNRVIAHLCDRYFKEIYGWTKDTRLKKRVPYLFNNEFADYFEDISERLNIVEHFPLESPWGFLLINADGDCYHLGISTEGQQAPDNDGTLSSTPIEPTSIKVNDSDKVFDCAVYRYNATPYGNKITSFSSYIQGSRLSIPAQPIPQGSHRHDH